MEPPEPEKLEEGLDAYLTAYGRYAMSYPELCSEFVAMLSKLIKSSALYTLGHPVVIEALRKICALLRLILAAKKAGSVTIHYMEDSWYFNELGVPAATQEARNLNGFFRTHGIQNLTFLYGAGPFEFGALCEFLSASSNKQPGGGLNEALLQKGVKNIHTETVHYIKDPGYAPSCAVPEAPGPLSKAAQGPAVSASFQESGRRERENRPSGGVAPAPDRVSTGAGAAVSATLPPPAPDEAARAGGVPVNTDFGGLFTKLVESAVKDPRERLRAYKDALKLIHETMDRQVRLATGELSAEKERILNTRTRTEKVLSRVAEGKVVVDKEGKVLMMNPAAEAISGKRLVEAVGRHISESVNPGEHVLTLTGDMDLSGGKPLSGEVHVSGDEHVRSAMRRSMALLEDDEGRVVGAYSTLPEITKFKEAQRMQVEFLSRVTHDLQSPLASINSALEMLVDTASGKLDTVESRFLAISVRNTQRLTQMIRGILDFSKLQSGKMTVHPESASLAGMLNEAGEGLLPWAGTKGLKLIVRPPVPDLMVMADHARIVQVLTNLISNAIKSTPKGGSITVAVSAAANQEGQIVVGVRDTGCGIPKDSLKKIFDKFVQLETRKTLDEPQEGVGLGLAIVKEFVALHGGKLWVNSEEGKGATFYFTLPLAGSG
ncbi:MAG: ATP-binding protein [Elusimicrobiales bacterium]|jgi:two-component system phosphate regulon sensor histidine kinase PhoR